MNLGFPRILAISILGAWVLSGLRFVLEWVGVPLLPYLFDPLWVAPVAGAMIALEAGRFDVSSSRRLAITALYALLSRVVIGGLMLLARSWGLDTPLGRHDGRLMTVVTTQLLWAGVSFAIALFASAIAQRIVKEVSERPTGQM